MSKNIIDLRDMPVFFEEMPAAKPASAPGKQGRLQVDTIQSANKRRLAMPMWLRDRLKVLAIGAVVLGLSVTGVAQATSIRTDLIKRSVTQPVTTQINTSTGTNLPDNVTTGRTN
jgi:hypothetical protein